MELSPSERAILARFSEKTRIAGGAQAGYLLRLQSIRYAAADHSGVDVEGGLAALAEKGLVQPTEAGDRYYLTAEGAALLEADVG